MTDSRLFCLDANIFINSWKNGYPPDLFPELWREFSNEKHRLIFIKEIFDEINPISPADGRALRAGTFSREEFERIYSLRIWLENNGFIGVKIGANVEATALLLRQKYETEPGNRRGASINDIKLIAYARVHGLTLVTLEAMQRQVPGEKKNYKIPLICREEGIEYLRFVPFLRLLRGL